MILLLVVSFVRDGYNFTSGGFTHVRIVKQYLLKFPASCGQTAKVTIHHLSDCFLHVI